jgi:hypothetical protein
VIARGKRGAIAAATFATVLSAPGAASATGMQGHIFMAECGAERSADPRVRALVSAHGKSLVNGAFFPDSGYTAADHDQGEVPHWEQYVDAYVKLVRERYPSPLTDTRAAPHVAFILGIAAHGITDSTFDTLLFARSEEVDRAKMDDFDMSMDIFLVGDRSRVFVPELLFDADTQSAVFDRVPHKVPAANITRAMDTARSGIAGVTNFLYKSAESYGRNYPWARSHVFDPRTPGGYPFGAKVVARYYEELFRRLDGDVSADKILIGSYPDPEYPLATLDPARADGRVVLFFGHGLDRASISDKTVVLRDAGGASVPAKVAIFRGDKWPNVITVTPSSRWLPDAKYSVAITREIVTLNGRSPSADIQLAFTTCVPTTSGGDCAEVTGPAPPSACPITEAAHHDRPVAAQPEDEAPVAPPRAAPASTGGGCTVAPAQPTVLGAVVALLLLRARSSRRSRRP